MILKILLFKFLVSSCYILTEIIYFKMEAIYFISDIHVGAGTEDNEKSKINKLFSFLEYINNPQNKLYIVGDLFDFWFEYKHVIPKQNYQVFFQFSKLIENGVEINFIPGNHDYWTLNFFQDQIGFKVHPDIVEVELQSKKFFLYHGDGISQKDNGYRLLKRVFRNPINISLYRWLHPDLGVPLARLTSHTSRQHTANKIINDEKDYLDFAVDKFKKGFDFVVIGHSHVPSLENIEGKYLLNLGDWMYHFSYGILSNSKLSLKYWKP